MGSRSTNLMLHSIWGSIGTLICTRNVRDVRGARDVRGTKNAAAAAAWLRSDGVRREGGGRVNVSGGRRESECFV